MDRLLTWARMNDSAGRRLYLRRTLRVNLLQAWPGRRGAGDEAPVGAMAEGARRLLPSWRCRRVVLFGRATASAVALAAGIKMRIEPYRWIRGWSGGPRALVLVPHPSGVSRYWNDVWNRMLCGDFIRGLLNHGGEEVDDA
jgi:hypothetical protein